MESTYSQIEFRSLSGRFRDVEHEQAYRVHILHENVNQATLFIGLTTLPAILAVIRNFSMALTDDFTPEWLTLNLGLNVATLVLLVGFAVIVRFAVEPRMLDTVLLTYMILVGTVIAAGQYYRPADFVGTVYTLLILNNLLIMPVPLRLQLPPTVAFIAVMIWILVTRREPTYANESTNQIIAMLTFLVVGVAFSVMLGRQRRTNFVYIEKERETTRALEQTLDDLKKLSGLIPICKSCKNILDEGGQWQTPDAFIASHSTAEFSQGICPDCVDVAEKK